MADALVPRVVPRPPPAHLERHRLELGAGAATTLHVARHPRAHTRVEVVRLRRPQPLVAWCADHEVDEALVGGFFVRPHGVPLGELRTGGLVRRHAPFAAPWADVRGCLHVRDGRAVLVPRDALPAAPAGDLLQAGPLLVRGGRPVLAEGDDPEGFSSGAGQFDSDITAGRYPRAALALTPDAVLAVACDGRADDEAGLSLRELADALVALGAESALNLDGGGSTSLVCGGALRNVPREGHGVALPAGRPISTAVVLDRRDG